MGVDVHRTTVIRWQLKLRAARLAGQRAFYHKCYLECHQAGLTIPVDDEFDPHSPCVNNYTIAAHGLECDATNNGFGENLQTA